MIEIHSMIVAVFDENKKYYSQFFLDKCLYKSWIIKNWRYDRIDASEGINVNKTSESKECDTCHQR